MLFIDCLSAVTCYLYKGRMEIVKAMIYSRLVRKYPVILQTPDVKSIIETYSKYRFLYFSALLSLLFYHLYFQNCRSEGKFFI